MVHIKRLASIFLVWQSIHAVVAFDCPSWLPWCTSSNTANTDSSVGTTAIPQMTTLQGSVCNCWLAHADRTQREKIVTELMKAAFINITKAASNRTMEFQAWSVSNWWTRFDLEKAVTLSARTSDLQSSFDFIKTGGHFYMDWKSITSGYAVNGFHLLFNSIDDLYINPLSEGLHNIAKEHGTSVGIFRAGSALKYDGICSKDQPANSTNSTAYLFAKQCQIDLSYLVYFTLNDTCNGPLYYMRVATTTEIAFDDYFPTKERRYVRATTRWLSQDKNSNKTRVWTELFFTTNELIKDIYEHLKSMNDVSLPGCYFKGVMVSSNLSLVNCTSYDPLKNFQNCTPASRTTLPVTNPAQPSSSLTNSFSFGSTVPQDGNANAPNITNPTTEIGSTQSNNEPLSTSQGVSSGTSSFSNSGSTSSEISFPPSPVLLSSSTDEASLPSSVTPSTQTYTITSISTTTVASNNSVASVAQTLVGMDSTIYATTSVIADSATMNTPSTLESIAITPSLTPSTGQFLQDSSYTSQTSMSEMIPPALDLSTSSTGIGASTRTTEVNTDRSANNTTPFDEDPFFKAVVPVFTKKFNDEFLLRAVGTMPPVTYQANFYSITIPVCISAVILSMLCLMCLQVDWLAVCSGKKETEKLLN